MEIAIIIISGIFLVIGLAVSLISFMKGRGEYDDIIDMLDEDEFKTKALLPIGLFLDDSVELINKLPGNLQTPLRRYDMKVTALLTELYGERERDTYCAVHRASKWVIALLLFCFLSVFALIFAGTGDYDTAPIFTALAPVALIAAPFLMDRELNGKIEERREKIILEFPEFINKLILLVNAGSTITGAWNKIVADSKSNTPLYRELRHCRADIQAGKSEAIAYEEFGRRCKVKEVVKFVSVVILNLRKGGSEVIPALRAQSDECWEARKAAARRLGEKASSKLLIPMAIMLLGIILIVALPAVLAMTGV